MRVDEATFFATPADFRAWLAEHGASEDQLWVGYHRKGTGTPSIVWAESVDEALCYGWIDGRRRKIDDERYCVRFTPRRPISKWSKRNIERVETLIADGRMTDRGLAAYEARTDERSGGSVAAMSSAPPSLPPEYERMLRDNREAWRFLEGQPPSYRNVALHWVMDAKRESTRERRLKTLIEDAENGLRIKALRR